MMFLKASRRALGALVLVIAASGAAPAAASFDFLFSAERVSDDSQFFLNLAVRDSGLPRPAIEPVLPRLRSIETDLPIVLFLARHSGKSPDLIVGLRRGGLSWGVVFGRVGVPLDVLFVGIDRDPGPPYGKAWGYRRKHPHSQRISDADVLGLVRVQTGHRISGAPHRDLLRPGGASVVYSLVADSKGRPYDKGKGMAKPKGGHPAGLKGGGQGRGGGKKN